MQLIRYTILITVLLCNCLASMVNLQNYRTSLASVFGMDHRIAVRRPFQQRETITKRNGIVDTVKSGLQNRVEAIQGQVNPYRSLLEAANPHMLSINNLETNLLRHKREQSNQNGVNFFRKRVGVSGNNVKLRSEIDPKKRQYKRSDEIEQKEQDVIEDVPVIKTTTKSPNHKRTQTGDDELEVNENENEKGKLSIKRNESTPSSSESITTTSEATVNTNVQKSGVEDKNKTTSNSTLAPETYNTTSDATYNTTSITNNGTDNDNSTWSETSETAGGINNYTLASGVTTANVTETPTSNGTNSTSKLPNELIPWWVQYDNKYSDAILTLPSKLVATLMIATGLSTTYLRDR